MTQRGQHDVLQHGALRLGSGGNRSQGDHRLDLPVELRVRRRGNEEQGGGKRIADVDKPFLLRQFQDVVDARRGVVPAHLVPPEQTQ